METIKTRTLEDVTESDNVTETITIKQGTFGDDGYQENIAKTTRNCYILMESLLEEKNDLVHYISNSEASLSDLDIRISQLQTIIDNKGD